MKKYKELVKQLPAKTVVMAFGRFQPPTTGHELLVNAVKKVAASNSADHVIYASRTQDKKSNPLPVDRKVYYLKRMFPKTNFVAASDQVRTFIEAAKELNKKYNKLIMIAGSDRVGEYEKILTKYNGSDFNFEKVQVISAGERDPDSDTASGMSGTKMREAAVAGDFAKFKKGLPHTLTEMDGRRLMNEIRKAFGHPVIKEQVYIETTTLREQYVAGEIFLIGEKVQDDKGVYEIMDRGANYVTVADASGELHKKWLNQITTVEAIQEDIPTGYAPAEVTFKGYTTKNLHHSADAAKAFQMTIQRAGAADPVAVLNALKATDTYMGLNDLHLEQGGKAPDESEINKWKAAHAKAKESLDRVGEFLHHEDYWHMHQHELEGLLTNYQEAGKEDMNEELTDKTIKTSDKVKVARIIATTFGIDDAEGSSSPEQLVNAGLRKIKTKTFTPDSLKIIQKMLDLATEAGIKYNHDFVPSRMKSMQEGTLQDNGTDKVEPKTSYIVVKDRSEVGHSMVTPTDTRTTRHMKVRHQLGEAKDTEGHFEAAQEHKKKALAAQKAGKMMDYHGHMSNHHEAMAAWNEKEGRFKSADMHNEKAEKHNGEFIVHAKRGISEEVLDENEAWEKAYNVGKYEGSRNTKTAQERIAKAHAKNPKFHEFLKKHGLHTGMSVGKTNVAPKADAAKKAESEKKSLQAYGATKGTATGGEHGGGEKTPEHKPASKEDRLKMIAAKFSASKKQKELQTDYKKKMTGHHPIPSSHGYEGSHRGETEYGGSFHRYSEEVEQVDEAGVMMDLPNPDRTDKKGISYNPFRKQKTAADLERIRKALEREKRQKTDSTGMYKKQTNSSRKKLVGQYNLLAKHIGEEVELEEDLDRKFPEEGSKVKVVGNVEHKGKTGTHVSSNKDGSFHVINIGGKHHSFHGSDLKSMSEEVVQESHVEFRIDHRNKSQGDHESTFKDHDASVSDITDKATYVKVPQSKADSFKKTMKAKHGVAVELSEAYDVDHMPGKHVRGTLPKDCPTCHGRKFMYVKPDGTKHADKKTEDSKRVACNSCSGKGWVKEEVVDEASMTGAPFTPGEQKRMMHSDLKDAQRKNDHKEVENINQKIKAHKEKHPWLYKEEAELDEASQEGGKTKVVTLPNGKKVTIPAHTAPKSGFNKYGKFATLDKIKEENEKEPDDEDDFDMSDDEMEELINGTHDDEFLEVYDDHEIDTGEEDETEEKGEKEVNEEALNEVLSRAERMRTKIRFARTKAKRERREMIALKTRSSSAVLNKRARRMAILLMKKRIAKKPLNKLSIGEKERIERMVERRKPLINRLAMKLTPRMRKIESARLSHKKAGTTSTSGVGF